MPVVLWCHSCQIYNCPRRRRMTTMAWSQSVYQALPDNGMVCGYLHSFPRAAAVGLRSTRFQECSVPGHCFPENRILFRQGVRPSWLVACPRIRRHSRQRRRHRPNRMHHHNSIDRLCRTRIPVVSCINHRCNSNKSPCWPLYNRSAPAGRTSV